MTKSMADGLPWAVIVSSSRYFHNYRHTSNALSIYHTVRRLGVPDSQIILMLAGSVPCDVRNLASGSMFNDAMHRHELYPADVEVDYRGDTVTVDSLLGVLTDRLPPTTPASRRLRSGARSRVLLYLTGHGGEEFLKFHDQYELTALDLASALGTLFAQRRCAEVLLLADTCQAATLTSHLDAEAALLRAVSEEEQGRLAAARALQGPGLREPAAPAPMRVVSLSSAALGENSYSFEVDPKLGVAVSRRVLTHALTRLLSNLLRPAARARAGERPLLVPPPPTPLLKRPRQHHRAQRAGGTPDPHPITLT